MNNLWVSKGKTLSTLGLLATGKHMPNMTHGPVSIGKLLPPCPSACLFDVLFFFFLLFRAAPTVYESSQARGQIGAIAAGLPPTSQP